MANCSVLTCPIYHNVHSYCMLYESSVTYNNNDDDDDDDNKWLLLVFIIIHCTHLFVLSDNFAK